MNINYEVYDRMAHTWWNENQASTLASLRFLINPVRFGYFKNVLDNVLKYDYAKKEVLDVGSGGGFLSEEFARIGCKVTGIDPSEPSIEVAKEHAFNEKLEIKYIQGFGENLSFENDSFDIVYCCDTLEHVSDPEKVIGEISRVLQNNGIFFYDTINRTLMSKLMSIKVMQEWKSTAFVEPNVHLWKMFIKPEELFKIFEKNSLYNKEIKGVSPGFNFITHYFNLRKAVKKKISYNELGKRMKFHIDNNLSNSYVGYAIKAVSDQQLAISG